MRNDQSAFSLSRRQLLRRGVGFGAGALGAGALGAGAFAAGLPVPALADARDPMRQWPGVSAMVDDFVGSGKLPNMIATLGWGQDAPHVIAKGHRNYTGGGAVGPDTIYRIYSMTKPITGMAAMICIDEGLIALDQPIADILPAFAKMQVQVEYDGAISPDNLEPAKRPITIRHLLTHTAGLGYSIVQQGPIRDLYSDAGIVPGVVTDLPFAQSIFGGEAAPSLAEFADNLAQLPLVVQPGERWTYSVSLDLLGRIIEVVSGQAFDAFLQQRIFDPCGMDSTSFHVAAKDAERLVANYFFRTDIPFPLDLPESSVYLDQPAFPFGGAGLVSTARDYDRFLQMLAGFGVIDGRRVMSERAVLLGTSDLMPDTLVPGGEFRSGEFGYGAGGLVGLQGTQNAGLFGWSGAAGTVGMVNLALGLRLNLMVQHMPGSLYGLWESFPRTVAQDVAAMRAQ